MNSVRDASRRDTRAGQRYLLPSAEPAAISAVPLRGLVEAGIVALAARQLGRPYRLDGVVVHGDHRGRELGFPTANLGFDPVAVVPADGVYAGRVVLLGEPGQAGERGLGSAAISVGLPAIDVSDLPATGPLPAGNAHARTFNINLTCDNGITPKYTVDGTGNLLLFVSDVFANASTGNGIGTGVGIQLFEGDLTSTKVLTLGQAHAANRTTTLNQQISIPITARYYRYADRVDQVTPGLINVPAIFTMTYE